jgi:hypothetical protein
LARLPAVVVPGLCTCTRSARMCPVRAGARPVHGLVHDYCPSLLMGSVAGPSAGRAALQ